MPYSFNPFSGNFDNTPSTLKGDEAYSTLQSASGDWSTYDYVNSTFLPLTGGTLSGNLAIGGGPATLFVGSSAVGINTETPSEALTVVGNVSATGTVVGSNLNVSSWDSVYSTVQSKSATEWDNALANQYAHANFLPLTGGIVSGPTRFNDNVTIFGNLSCSGTQTFANTVFTTTSAVSVVHFGSGPAMWVGNFGDGDIASFYDIELNQEVFHIGGANGDFPNVGVKTSTPNKDFTVNGELSASNTIWAKDSNSDQWTSAYSTVQANSSVNWNYQGTDLKDLSANWQSTYTTVQAKSATEWDNTLANQYTHNNFLPLSGGTITGNISATGTIYGDLSPYFGPNTVIVKQGDNLAAKYTYATTLTPSGSAKSASNRVSLIILPGTYSLSSELVIGTEFVDLVGLGAQFQSPAVIVTNNTLNVTANDVRVSGVSVGAQQFKIGNNKSLQVFENCAGGIGSFGTGEGSVVSGKFTNCVGLEESFGGVGGTASGIFTNCSAGDGAFGGGFPEADASGVFLNCSAGGSSFGGGPGDDGNLTGKLISCRLTSAGASYRTPSGSGIIRFCLDGDNNIVNAG